MLYDLITTVLFLHLFSLHHNITLYNRNTTYLWDDGTIYNVATSRTLQGVNFGMQPLISLGMDSSLPLMFNAQKNVLVYAGPIPFNTPYVCKSPILFFKTYRSILYTDTL